LGAKIVIKRPSEARAVAQRAGERAPTRLTHHRPVNDCLLKAARKVVLRTAAVTRADYLDAGLVGCGPGVRGFTGGDLQPGCSRGGISPCW
jgi:hypothetical protein